VGRGVEGGEDRGRRREISEKKRVFGRSKGSFCGDVSTDVCMDVISAKHWMLHVTAAVVVVLLHVTAAVVVVLLLRAPMHVYVHTLYVTRFSSGAEQMWLP